MLKVPVTAEDHIQGDLKAPVILVEYGDYECPYCEHAYSIIKRVQKHFGKNLAFVFRNFPLKEVHPHAESAAESAEFAGAHGRFWEMHDRIFESQEPLKVSSLLQLAAGLELPAADLEKALKSGLYAERVRKDFVGGARSGVNGTPTFFINGERHDGSPEYEDLIEAIEVRGL